MKDKLQSHTKASYEYNKKRFELMREKTIDEKHAKELQDKWNAKMQMHRNFKRDKFLISLQSSVQDKEERSAGLNSP